MIVQPACEHEHREKVSALDVAVDAMVAKLVKAGEVAKNPAAKKGCPKRMGQALESSDLDCRVCSRI